MSARADDGRASPLPINTDAAASDESSLQAASVAEGSAIRIGGLRRSAATVTSRLLPGLAVAGLAALGLVATNPDEAEFERFASERVTEAALHEVCHEQSLPLLARFLVRDCPRLIESQRLLLGKLARAASQRRNFGLFSLYRTDLGGQQLLPDWVLPRYRALTLAAAGRFVILRSSQESGGSGEPGPGR